MNDNDLGKLLDAMLEARGNLNSADHTLYGIFGITDGDYRREKIERGKRNIRWALSELRKVEHLL